MNIIFFSHPNFGGHQSMPRFTRMLADGMKNRGHSVQIWSPPGKFFSMRVPKSFKKWMGYIDQYIIFPSIIRKRLRLNTDKTLYVFTDHALGPWIPLAANKLHVIHCHDFLAQQSALGEIPDNPTSRSGKYYQAFIRRGFQKGKNFISVSKKTQDDLHKFVSQTTINSKVVYNGLNNSFEPFDLEQSRLLLMERINVNLSKGYLLHVGGNQWYKNRRGVIEIYDAWRSIHPLVSVPLLMIGERPTAQLSEIHNQSQFKKDIHFLTKIEDKFVRYAYTGASLFLFPSLAEGFGWPIAEAMACGCPVITTDLAPMTEVAGDAASLIERRPTSLKHLAQWAQTSADVVHKIFNLTTYERMNLIKNGLRNATRFDSEKAMSEIEDIYLKVVFS